jgi:hypothetical protein
MKVVKRSALASTSAEPSYVLPDEPTPVDKDLQHYTTLVYGREKWGKTTFFASYPDALFLMTEPGAQGLSVYQFNAAGGGISDWSVFRAAVDLLEKDTSKFKNVVIDTADLAYDMCLDWTCATLNIEYPGKDDEGKQDFGKSWKRVKHEFLAQIHRIKRTGRGICFTSHCRSERHRTRNGDEYDRVYPSMSGQARGVVEALVDMFFFGEYFKDEHDRTVRCLVTEGDDSVWAGHRPIAGMGKLPQFLPIPEGEGYETLLGAFQGDVKGYDPMLLGKHRKSAEATGDYLIRARQRERKEGSSAASTPVRRVVKKQG